MTKAMLWKEPLPQNLIHVGLTCRTVRRLSKIVATTTTHVHQTKHRQLSSNMGKGCHSVITSSSVHRMTNDVDIMMRRTDDEAD